ncbi:MAG TPA: hypothetical protein VH913_17475 [Hyphomicrobiaceae bacterium]|jgi:hypothetical protein
MLARIPVCLGSIVLTHLVCPAVAARQPASDWTQCVNEGGVFTLDDQVIACTAVLQSARDTPANLALAHQYRLNAYRKKREKTGAVADPADKPALDTASTARAR